MFTEGLQPFNFAFKHIFIIYVIGVLNKGHRV